MNIAAVCCTYHRPKQLGWLIKCFLEQDYPAEKRQLVVLDDAGQYGDLGLRIEDLGLGDCRAAFSGDRWRLYSVARRFRSLGEKRNAAVDLVSADVEALAVWDDDDIYLPWALSASVAALQKAPWSRPGIVLHEQADGTLRQHQTGGLFHGGWAYTREAFKKAGGYPAINNGEDQALARRLQRIGTAQSDPCRLGFRPFYVYRWGSAGSYHLSGMGRQGYQKLAARPARKANLNITWPRDYRNATILPGVNPRVF